MAWNETYSSVLGGLAGSLLSNATQASNGVTNSANALAGMIQAKAQHDFENGLKLAALDDAHKADYEKKFAEAEKKSDLPDNPDMDKIGRFVEMINRQAVMEDL